MRNSGQSETPHPETIGECEEIGLRPGSSAEIVRECEEFGEIETPHPENIGGWEDFQKKAPILRLTDAAARHTRQEVCRAADARLTRSPALGQALATRPSSLEATRPLCLGRTRTV